MTTTVTLSPGENADLASPRRVRVAIIGSGCTGLGMGIRLRQAGVEDFEILERSHDTGGTWRDNSYIKRDQTAVTAHQVHGRTRNYPQLFTREGQTVKLRSWQRS